MNRREKAFFEFYKNLDHGIMEERYYAECCVMDKLNALIGNEEFKQILISKKGYILDDEVTLVMLEEVRKVENPPKSHFWWWIDEL